MSATQGIGSGAASGLTGISSGDIQTMSLEDLMFFVMSERSKILDESVRGYADQIQKRNDLMKLTNTFLAEARDQAATMTEDGDPAPMSAELAQFLSEQGISTPGTTASASSSMTAAEKAAIAQEIKTWIENEKPYTDDACIDADLPADLINKARSIGIEPTDDGDGAGQNWESSDWDSFKSDVEVALDGFNDEVANGGTGAATAAGSYTKAEWESVISNIQGFQEGLNNDSQLDMIKFQSLMSKYTTSVEMLSNVMKKLADSTAANVRNIS
jgi:hypothetical protein